MNYKEELKRRIAVEQAYLEEKEIEQYIDNIWCDVAEPVFNWSSSDYRIKETRTYIPFTYETFKEHRDRWIKDPGYKGSQKVIEYGDYIVTIITDRVVEAYSYDELLDHRVFDDTGEPCGQKVVR